MTPDAPNTSGGTISSPIVISPPGTPIPRPNGKSKRGHQREQGSTVKGKPSLSGPPPTWKTHRAYNRRRGPSAKTTSPSGSFSPQPNPAPTVSVAQTPSIVSHSAPPAHPEAQFRSWSPAPPPLSTIPESYIRGTPLPQSLISSREDRSSTLQPRDDDHDHDGARPRTRVTPARTPFSIAYEALLKSVEGQSTRPTPTPESDGQTVSVGGDVCENSAGTHKKTSRTDEDVEEECSPVRDVRMRGRNSNHHLGGSDEFQESLRRIEEGKGVPSEDDEIEEQQAVQE